MLISAIAPTVIKINMTTMVITMIMIIIIKAIRVIK
jgi:hypothetical protein